MLQLLSESLLPGIFAYHDRGRGSKLNDSALHGDSDRLRPVAGSKLLHDVFDVNFDGLFGDKEPFGDVAIAVAATNLLQYLDFAAGQRLIAVVFSKVRCYLLRNSLLPPCTCRIASINSFGGMLLSM